MAHIITDIFAKEIEKMLISAIASSFVKNRLDDSALWSHDGHGLENVLRFVPGSL